VFQVFIKNVYVSATRGGVKNLRPVTAQQDAILPPSFCKGAYASFRLCTDIDGNWVDTVANVDSSDSICISVR